MEHLQQHIEALIFSSPEPISAKEIRVALQESFEAKFKIEQIEAQMEALEVRYQAPEYAFELVKISEGYQYMTKGAYHPVIAVHLKKKTKRRLSKAALETLSIIAYKQPVTKSEAEKVRGVSCDYSIQKLLEKELVEILGRSDAPGRPLLYGTSQKFMDYFGLKDLKELPKLKEIASPDNEVGEAAPIEEEQPKAKTEANGKEE